MGFDAGDFPLVDDIGSFPLPDYADKQQFKKFYWNCYDAIIRGFKGKIRQNRGINGNVVLPIEDSFALKLQSGLDIATYPRHWDMHTPFLQPIKKYEEEPYNIDPTKAKVIEMEILHQSAKSYYEDTGKKLHVRCCITGALELFLKEHGFGVYKDIALNLADSINKFAKNSIYNSKYIETTVICIDEPSIGIVSYSGVDDSDITEILEKETKGLDSEVHIHLHNLNKAEIALNCHNIDVITAEYANDQSHVIERALLEKYDKFIRVGICRTNLDYLIAKRIEDGVNPRQFDSIVGIRSMIDAKKRIKKRFRESMKHYEDRLKYVGPDCGLISWQYQDVAFDLLKRVVDCVAEEKKKRK